MRDNIRIVGTEVMSHKEENPSRIKSDSQDRQKIRNKLEMSTDSLDPTDHSEMKS